MELILMVALAATLVGFIRAGMEDSRIHRMPPARLQTIQVKSVEDWYPRAVPVRPSLGLIVDGYTVVQPAN